MDPDLSPSRRARRAGLAVVVLALAAGIGTLAWQQAQQRAVHRLAQRASFDLNAAMDLAGSMVPPETESFYFFVLEPDKPNESSELADKLVQAAGEHEFLGITGVDSNHNREVLIQALEQLQRRDLAGLIVIYVGPDEHQAELEMRVNATGAQFRFVAYQPAPAHTI